MFDIFGPVALVSATIVGFVFGAVWYGVLGKAWVRAAELPKSSAKPAISTMIIGVLCQAVMTLSMAGVMWHMGISDIRGGLVTAVLVWAGFVITSMIVNHRFQGQKWALTFIDGGHWLGVLAIQGVLLTALSE